MEIKPWQSISIVVDEDHIKEATDVRDSIVYEIIEDKLIIAQTDPPILESQIDKTITLTYLTKGKGGSERFGFFANIVGLIKDYKLSADYNKQAVTLLKKSKPIEYNLRFFYRIEPPSNSGIYMFVSDKRVNLLDISIGGAKISHNLELELEFKPEKIIKIMLSIDHAFFDINATVVRTWRPKEERMAKYIEFVALKFMSTGMEFKDLLGRKITSIERELRLKGVL